MVLKNARKWLVSIAIVIENNRALTYRILRRRDDAHHHLPILLHNLSIAKWTNETISLEFSYRLNKFFKYR